MAPAPDRLLVLHLSTERGLRGGERQLLLLARGLLAHGLHQAVAAPAASPLIGQAAELGLATVALVPRPAWHPLSLLRLARWLRAHPGALVHAHTSPALTLAAALRRLAPVGAVVHTRRVAFPLRRGRKYRTAADRYVAISGAVAGALLAAGLEEARLGVIPSAVDLEAVDAAAPTAELAREPGRPTVGCVAALSPEKGHATLLAAWAEVSRSLPGARLVLLGDGPERPRVAAAVARLAPGTVLLAGHRDDVPAWLKALDLYAQPSLAEGLGSSVLDAMACRLAVVASATGGLPEAVADRQTGLLGPPGDAGALAAALLALLGEPDRAAAMGSAGRARVEALFRPETMVEGYLRVYREATRAT